jgi:spermidine synthase
MAVVPRQRVVEEPVDFGTATLVPDRDRPGGWTLLLDGAPQSYVAVDDPEYLHFEYVRRLGKVVDAAAPAGTPVRVLHLGGGGLTLARYIAAKRPGSRQRVAEHDAALTGLVRRVIPLPRRADVRVRTIDARAAVEAYGDASYDLVIADVYHDTQMPSTLASVEFAGHVARILRSDGVYAVNVADLPPAAFTKAYVATLRAVFAHVSVIASTAMVRGRRHGNAIAVASSLPLDLSRALEPSTEVVHGNALDRFVGGARPMSDSTAKASPKPPAALFQ